MIADQVDAGLGERACALVRSVLARHPEVGEARVFGSRALKHHRPESDVDLALYGEIDEALANRIGGELDELRCRTRSTSARTPRSVRNPCVSTSTG